MPSSPSGQAEPRGTRGDRLSRLIARPFAHRGLHGNGLVENSRGAFAAAIAAGHGIELDVQASRDGQAIVFHDYSLERLAEGEGKLADRSAGDLARIRLRGSDETIPSLPEVLALIGGRAGLLIEVKSPDRRIDVLSGAVARALETYDGPVAVMSFNPEVGHWFSAHAPATLRGLVVTEADKKGMRGKLTRRFSLWRSRPHFLAYDIRDLPSRFAGAQRANGLKVLTWTCRSDEDKARAALHADQIIFELPA